MTIFDRIKQAFGPSKVCVDLPGSPPVPVLDVAPPPINPRYVPNPRYVEPTTFEGAAARDEIALKALGDWARVAGMDFDPKRGFEGNLTTWFLDLKGLE